MAEKKKYQDYSSDESRENKLKNDNAVLREVHDAKIRDYIDTFEQKNVFRRDKNILYQKKQAIQQVQRTEALFIKDLHQIVTGRNSTLPTNTSYSNNRYELKKGPSSAHSSARKSSGDQLQQKSV